MCICLMYIDIFIFIFAVSDFVSRYILRQNCPMAILVSCRKETHKLFSCYCFVYKIKNFINNLCIKFYVFFILYQIHVEEEIFFFFCVWG